MNVRSPNQSPQLYMSNEAHPQGRWAPFLQDQCFKTNPYQAQIPMASWCFSQDPAQMHPPTSILSFSGYQMAYLKYLEYSALCLQTQKEKCMTYSWYLFFISKDLLFCHKINSTLDSDISKLCIFWGMYETRCFSWGKQKLLKNWINLWNLLSLEMIKYKTDKTQTNAYCHMTKKSLLKVLEACNASPCNHHNAHIYGAKADLQK